MIKYYLFACLLLVVLSSCGGNYDPIRGGGRAEVMENAADAGYGAPSSEMEAVASQLIESGEVLRAHGIYTQLLISSPDNVSYLLKVAELERMLGRFNLARKNYDKVLQLSPDNYEANEGIARLYLVEGKFDEAIDLLLFLADMVSDRWQIFDNLGTVKSLKGDYDGARKNFKRALLLYPSSARVLNNMALSEILAGDVKSGLKILLRASEQMLVGSKNRLKVDLNLALAHALNQDLDAAQDVVSQHLSGRELYNNMGVYAILAKDKKMADAFLQKALSSSLVYYDKPWKNLDKLSLADKGKVSKGDSSKGR